MATDSYPISQSRKSIKKIVDGRFFQYAITTLIIVNAIGLGMETNKNFVSNYGSQLFWLDKSILVVFTVELLMKFYADRMAFFRSGWNLFDLCIVGISWMPANGALSILRTLRILRILRLVSVVPQMKRVIVAIGSSIPGMVSVVSVLALVFYVASVLVTNLYGTHADPNMQEWFGSIGSSAYTLFQIMTLESWSMGIVRPTMEIFPLSWIFFIPFIIITSFAVLNFFIGIIVDSMQVAHKLEAEEHGNEEDIPMSKKDLSVILARLDELEEKLAKNGSSS